MAGACGSSGVLPYFRKKIHRMETPKKKTGLWWLLFFASTAALIIAIVAHWEWLTLILPFQCTSFVKAMNIL
jgi:hypothetical protein